MQSLLFSTFLGAISIAGFNFMSETWTFADGPGGLSYGFVGWVWRPADRRRRLSHFYIAEGLEGFGPGGGVGEDLGEEAEAAAEEGHVEVGGVGVAEGGVGV
jgi:hypothetical protein